MSAIIPSARFIGRGPSTERLYQLEEARSKAVTTAAEELAKVWGMPDLKAKSREFWDRIMPAALLDTLDGFQPSVAIAAALGYLASKGFDLSCLAQSRIGNVGVYYAVEGGMVEARSVERRVS